MNEKFNARFGSPMMMFFCSVAMIFIGIVISEELHPARMHLVAIAMLRLSRERSIIIDLIDRDGYCWASEWVVKRR